MIFVIVDFDNYIGTNVNSLKKEDLELIFKEIVEQCEKYFYDFSSIQIRLYGGWYNATTFTKQASLIQHILSQVNVFPKIKGKKIIRGNISLVSTLYEIPSYNSYQTYKEKEGIPRVRINFDQIDSTCNSNREHCPKFILYKFTSKKNKTCSVLECENIHKDVFKAVEQKMVDTMIACDVMSAVKDDSIKGVFVLSDDQDHFPSYAIASINRNKENKFILGIKNKDSERFDIISKLLEPFNIKIITMT